MRLFQHRSSRATALARRLRAFGVSAACFLMLFGLIMPTVTSAADKLTVYSGRAERLIKPVLDAFTAKTGIQIELLSSGTTELVNRMKAEGDRSPADAFITNDAGSLEMARTAGLFRPLNMREVERAIPAQFRAADNSWIGLSGRFWIVVYNTTLVKPDQIKSLLDLADPMWKDKIAVPNAGSEYLQAGVSVIRASLGDDHTKKFLEGIRDNAGTQVYQKSSQIVDAVAKGQVAMGIVNHYYVYRHLAAQPAAPLAVVMPDQQEGGMGAIMNVAGIGILKHTPRVENAKLLVEFLVAQAGQKMFADLDKEYPLHPEVKADPILVERKSFRAALVPLTKLAELREPTLLLIEQVGMR
ncbi:extracellular solute-binding protein [Candidatus Nitrospira nitrificans]|uniref:Putative ABC transporter, periplasmic binding component, Fe3+ transport system n=1 Tax=Candidatus Nitrospira nitrificans TaxID=1742973 RepID=A0A0S4LMA3_9BACT|nr:extracellular solute-binding protein [Candidatus Nitrospira nitrificans]CUS38652.1 putative ABC transporter, periplasmic binding component, Fe3+ transport system [Candidatus Nitrospira nitrificans]